MWLHDDEQQYLLCIIWDILFYFYTSESHSLVIIEYLYFEVGIMMFNNTFNNISVILWGSVLLVHVNDFRKSSSVNCLPLLFLSLVIILEDFIFLKRMKDRNELMTSNWNS